VPQHVDGVPANRPGIYTGGLFSGLFIFAAGFFFAFPLLRAVQVPQGLAQGNEGIKKMTTFIIHAWRSPRFRSRLCPPPATRGVRVGKVAESRNQGTLRAPRLFFTPTPFSPFRDQGDDVHATTE